MIHAPSIAAPLPGFQFDPRAARVSRLAKVIRAAARHYEFECRSVGWRQGRPSYRALFVTLTYAANSKGTPRDISEYLKRLRHFTARRGLKAPVVWVAEVQARGALHYHLIIWLPRGLHLPKPDRSGWWPHGMSNLQTARNPVGYLCKYASKCRPEDLAKLRKGTRLYGYGGGHRSILEGLRRQLRPRWIARIEDARDPFLQELRIEQESIARERYALACDFADASGRPPPPKPRWLAAADAAAADVVEINDDPRDALYPGDLMSDAQLHAHRRRARVENQRRFDLMMAGRALLARVTGGFVDRVTGEFFETPYRCVVQHGTVTVYRKDQVTA